MITAIRKVAIEVSDLQKTLAFFSETLNLPVLRDLAWRGKQDSWEMGFSVSGPTVAIVEHDAAQSGSKPGQVTIVFQTDDIQSDYENLRAKGVVPIRPPAFEEYEGMVAYFEGPHGVRIALLEPSEEA